MKQREHTSHWTQTIRAIHYCMVLHGIARYCMVLHGITWYLVFWGIWFISLINRATAHQSFFHFIRLDLIYSVFMFLLSKCSVSMFSMCVLCNLQINTCGVKCNVQAIYVPNRPPPPKKKKKSLTAQGNRHARKTHWSFLCPITSHIYGGTGTA